MKYKILADDGTPFETAAQCREYEEQEKLAGLLTDMSKADVLEALSRVDVHLANAIERAGNIIAAKRRADGDLRRKKKTDAEKPVEVGAAARHGATRFFMKSQEPK